MKLRFKPIELEQQDRYRLRLAECPQICSDYSFLNLWAWAEEYGLQWAWEDPLVWIRQTRPSMVFWAPVGPWEEVDWRGRLADSAGDFHEFIRVPRQLVDCWRARLSDRVRISEQRGHWDYLYAVADLVELKGNRYHKKKNLLNQFKKKYAFTYQPLDEDLVPAALAMQADWCTWRDCESADVLAAENRAIARTLQYWSDLKGLLGGAILVENRMAAYTVAEALTPDVVLIHFEKGDTTYKGIYQAINQMFLQHSAAEFRLVNREQDLDAPGLRKAKLSYLPVDFVRKYRVELSGTFRA